MKVIDLESGIPLDVEEIGSRAIEHFGRTNQINKAKEELSELLSALIKEENGNASHMDVCDEIADVTIMCVQLRMIYGMSRVDQIIAQKCNRLQRRLAGTL